MADWNDATHESFPFFIPVLSRFNLFYPFLTMLQEHQMIRTNAIYQKILK